jgi:DNA-directed RNA polymerase specialized sigma24 family protein
MLAAWDELPHRDIADLLGCSVDAVDQRLHCARRRLARQYHVLEGHQQPEGAPLPRIDTGGQG